MLLRSLWVLPLGLALLASPASAVPCREDSCSKKSVRAGRGPSSPPPSLQLNLSRSGQQQPFAVWRALLDGGLPPGLFGRDQLLPGLRGRSDLVPRVRNPRSSPSPPADPRLDPLSEPSVAVPEPTALLLFASGLLVARVALRRRRS